MKIIKKEYHTVVKELSYDLDENEIVERFESVENFMQLLEDGDYEATDFLDMFLQDQYDDWVSDRKGGYDVTFEIEEDE
jgi:hypothetical protein